MSWKLLILIAPIVALTATYLHPSVLLLLNFPFVLAGVEDWSVAGIRFDPTDLVLFALAISVAAGRATNVQVPRARLNFAPWAAIGILVSIGYLQFSETMDPVRMLYQLYRYCWKPILFYPLVVMFFATDSRRRDAMTASIVLAGALAAAMAIEQGYTGERRQGPFNGPNALGGALVAPLILCVTASLYARQRRWLFVCACAVIIARGMLFSHSRGAMVGTFGGVSLFLAFFVLSSNGLTRLVRYGAVGCALFALLLVVRPDILYRPSVQQLLSSTQGTQDSNMQWRMQQRWPHFINRIKQRPYLGYGTDRDWGLATRANTPHNGYLSLCMYYGVPVAVLYVFFGVVTVVRGIRIYATSGQDPGDRMFALSAAAAVAGILTHSLVESVILIPFVGDLYWTLAALVACRATAVVRQDSPRRLPVRRARSALSRRPRAVAARPTRARPRRNLPDLN